MHSTAANDTHSTAINAQKCVAVQPGRLGAPLALWGGHPQNAWAVRKLFHITPTTHFKRPSRRPALHQLPTSVYCHVLSVFSTPGTFVPWKRRIHAVISQTNLGKPIARFAAADALITLME